MKLRRALGLVGLGATLAVGVLFLVPLGRCGALAPPGSFAGRSAFSLSVNSTSLIAGAARVRIAPPAGATLAGYAGYRKAEGSGGPLFARALALQAGGLQAVIVSIDALLIPADLEEEIVRLARLPPEACALIAATHTHSGLGGTWDNALAAALGAGRFDPRAREAVSQAAAAAITQAFAALGPAELSAGRSALPLAVPRTGAKTDDRLSLLRVTRVGGKPLALVSVYGMHPTLVPRSGRALDGDWPGAAAQKLEAGGGVALILQGAVGNATWPREAGEGAQAALARVAARFANAIESAARQLSNLPKSAPAAFACAVRIAALPPPEASAAIPWPLRRAAANLLSLADPRFALQTELSLGGLHLVGVPGEPSAALSSEDTVLVGLADGYVGYVESAEAVRSGSGESARTWFGPELANALGLRAE